MYMYSAVATSTTMVISVTYQNKTYFRPKQHHHEFPLWKKKKKKICVKPEAPELTIDDSQNSSVQLTGTIDLFATDVIETTSVTNEASDSSEVLCRQKAQKYFSGDETECESHQATHTCHRAWHCDEDSNQHCPKQSKHTCMSHCHLPEKQLHLSESDEDRNVQYVHLEGEEHKIFIIVLCPLISSVKQKFHFLQ